MNSFRSFINYIISKEKTDPARSRNRVCYGSAVEDRLANDAGTHPAEATSYPLELVEIALSGFSSTSVGNTIF